MGGPFVTTRLMVTDLVSPAAVALTKIGNVPRGVTVPQFDVWMVIVTLEPVVGSVLNVAVAPAGKPVTLRSIEAGKVDRAIDSVADTLAPCFTVTPGAESVKLITVSVAQAVPSLVCACESVARTHTWYVPAELGAVTVDVTSSDDSSNAPSTAAIPENEPAASFLSAVVTGLASVAVAVTVTVAPGIAVAGLSWTFVTDGGERSGPAVAVGAGDGVGESTCHVTLAGDTDLLPTASQPWTRIVWLPRLSPLSWFVPLHVVHVPPSSWHSSHAAWLFTLPTV